MEPSKDQTPEQIAAQEVREKAAETWAKDNGTIYGQNGDRQAIADLDTARGMATFEDAAHNPNTTEEYKKATMDIVAKREESAEADINSLTLEQKKFVEAIGGIVERHPGVLEVEIDGGQKFWKIKGSTDKEIMFFSQNGVYDVATEKGNGGLSEISLKKLSDILDLTPDRRGRFISGGVSKDPNVQVSMGFYLAGLKLDLENTSNQDWLANNIALGDRLVVEEKQPQHKETGHIESILNKI
jgi:hypothetical protein